MEIKEGYVYHIKNSYFELVNDNKLMKNHEGNSTRPNYFCVKMENNDILWFIPMSSKVEKYKTIVEDKIKKYKKCDTIVIGNYRGKDHAFLIQNMFPITVQFYLLKKEAQKNAKRNFRGIRKFKRRNRVYN